MEVMNPNVCTIMENFSTVCGHVASIVEHADHCPHSQDPQHYPQYYPEDSKSGQFIYIDDHFLTGLRWVGAQITESRCIYCEAVEQGTPFVAPSRTWISDVGEGEREHKVVSPAEIASRREFWGNFIADHAVLSQRQRDLFEVHRAALTELQQYDARFGNEEIAAKLASAVIISKKIHEWYDVERYLYLGMVRMMGEMEIALLFDPSKLTSLTYELLYPVNPDEIPSGEVCGICMNDFNSAEPSQDVRRLFCGRHLFHHECIVPWFDKSEGPNVSCPMCRKSKQFYRAPLLEELGGDDSEPSDDLPEPSDDLPEPSDDLPELNADLPELNGDESELNGDESELSDDDSAWVLDF